MSGSILLLILGFVGGQAWPLLQQVGVTALWRDASWHPVSGEYNLMPMLLGTVIVSLGALVVAIPLGIGSAIFCRFYAPGAIALLYRRLIELLAGIPSVVYGFWGLVVLVPLINRWHPPGASALAGIWVLTLMILPTIALTTEASFDQIPARYFQGAAALGFSRWGTVWRIALPAARAGVINGIGLGAGRALGETMAVLMVCGNVVQVPESLFDPVRTLTANIALEMAYALSLHRSALFVSGLVLMGLVIAVALLAEALALPYGEGGQS